jgi:hypothetical protein
VRTARLETARDRAGPEIVLLEQIEHNLALLFIDRPFPVRTRETVEADTPASFAISYTVTRRSPFFMQVAPSVFLKSISLYGSKKKKQVPGGGVPPGTCEEHT